MQIFKKRTGDKRLLPGIGRREMATSKILESNICDSNTGTSIGKAHEVVTKWDGGSTVTTLVLPGGEIVACAEEWKGQGAGADQGTRGGRIKRIYL